MTALPPASARPRCPHPATDQGTSCVPAYLPDPVLCSVFSISVRPSHRGDRSLFPFRPRCESRKGPGSSFRGFGSLTLALAHSICEALLQAKLVTAGEQSRPAGPLVQMGFLWELFYFFLKLQGREGPLAMHIGVTTPRPGAGCGPKWGRGMPGMPMAVADQPSPSLTGALTQAAFGMTSEPKSLHFSQFQTAECLPTPNHQLIQGPELLN